MAKFEKKVHTRGFLDSDLLSQVSDSTTHHATEVHSEGSWKRVCRQRDVDRDEAAARGSAQIHGVVADVGRFLDQLRECRVPGSSGE